MIYIVWHYYSNGVDDWQTLHSVWSTKEEADGVELNLSINNEDPTVGYTVQEVEIGRVLM